MTRQKIPQHSLRFTIKSSNSEKKITYPVSGDNYGQVSFTKHWGIDKYNSRIAIQFIFDCLDLINVKEYSSSQLKEIYVNKLDMEEYEMYCENWIGDAI